MLAAVIMTGLCVAGIAFNVRFMVALFREPSTRRVVHRMRMKLDPCGIKVKKRSSRQALPIS